MKYYIIAGEPSGDLHGANLIKALLQTDSDVQIRFWGGDLMQREAGGKGELVIHYKEDSVMGYWEVIKNLNRIKKRLQFCKKDIKKYQPDVVIFIDYPGFNLRIAKYCKKIGVKTFYYIAPKVWAWKRKRVFTMRKVIDKLYIIFPFEVDFFKQYGIDAFYGGNPLIDSVEQNRNDAEVISSERPIIALVPGSRKQEVVKNLETMAEVVKAFSEYQFIVTAVDWLDAKLYTDCVEGSDILVEVNNISSVFKSSVGAIVTSGTATLEAALYNVPQVVCYRTSKLSAFIGRRLIKIPYISLVNIILDKEAVVELLQEKYTVQRTIEELKLVLPQGDKHNEIMKNYTLLRDMLGEVGASKRVAQDMVDELSK